MNILVYANFFYPSIGGVERNTVVLSQALWEINHNVKILTPSILSSGEELPLPFPIIRTKSFFSLFNEILKSDIVVLNGGICLFPVIISLILRKKTIPIHQMAYDSKKKLGLKETVLYRIKNLLQLKTFKIVGVSQSVLHTLEGKIPASKKFVLYNPVSIELSQKASSCRSFSKEIDIIYVGRLIEGKGIYTLVEALKLLDKQNKRYKIQIVGSGSEKETIIKELINLKNISFSLCEITDHEQLAEFYSKARVLVLPSSTHLEGSPLVIAEAFSFNLPVIASNQAANVEVVGKGGIIFEIDNYQDLSNKLSILLDDEECYLKYQGFASKMKARYSYQYYREKLKEITY